MGSAAGVADRIADMLNGLAQGGVTAIGDIIATVLRRDKPRVSPRGAKVARSTATQVRSSASDATEAAIEATRRAKDASERTARTAQATGSSAKAGAERTVRVAKRSGTSTARAAKAGAKGTVTSARKSAKRTATTAKRGRPPLAARLARQPRVRPSPPAAQHERRRRPLVPPTREKPSRFPGSCGDMMTTFSRFRPGTVFLGERQMDCRVAAARS